MHYSSLDISIGGCVRPFIYAIRKIVEPPDEDVSLYPRELVIGQSVYVFTKGNEIVCGDSACIHTITHMQRQ